MLSRRLLLATSVSVFGSLAGCSGVLEDATTHEASAATVPDDVHKETGYQEKKVEPHEIQRTFEVEDRSQDVTVVNWRAEYDRSIQLDALGSARGAVFTVLSTPQVNVLGKEFNPVDDMSTQELAQRVQENYSGVDNIRSVGEDEMTILGETTTVGKFKGNAEVGDSGVDVTFILRLSEAIKHDGDFIIPVAIYPDALRDSEADKADRLIRATSH
jgi:hypothetical protein